MPQYSVLIYIHLKSLYDNLNTISKIKTGAFFHVLTQFYIKNVA